MLKQQTTPYTITYHAVPGPRPEPDLEVLENRWLHKVFLVTHIPAAWPGWKLAAGLVLAAALVWLVWLPAGITTAGLAAAIYLTFALADWLLLGELPRSGRSFGPVGPQLFVMTAPRVGAAVAVAVAALFFRGQPEAMGALLGVMVLFQLLGSLIYAWGTLREPFSLGLSRVTVHPAGLSAGAPPIRLLHLSDLHVERLTRREERLLPLIEQARPDLIVITGDYLNLSYVNDPVARAEVRQLLARIHAPLGVYATLGSPPVDPPDTTPSLFDGLDNIRLLRDEAAVLRFKDGRSLSLLGLDCTHDLKVDGQRFEALAKLAPGDSARILLYHSPELMPLVRTYPIDLYLCGHTHGGQMRLPFYGAVITSSALGKRYEIGPYLEQGTTLYISRGIGLEGLSAPRMRLLSPPEIILFSLEGRSSKNS